MIPLITNKRRLKNVTATYPIVVVFGFSKKAANSNMIWNSFNQVASYYQNIRFYRVNSSLAKKIAIKRKVPLPATFFYLSGNLTSIYPYPESEIAFLRIFDLLFREQPVISTLEDLYKNIGYLKFTILTTEDHYSQALEIHFTVSSHLQEVDILKVTPKLLRSLEGIGKEAAKYGMALYRKEDLSIVPFDGSIKDFYRASFPVYRIIYNADIFDEKITLFSLTTPNFSSIHREYLWRAAKKFPEVVFGYLKQEFLPLGQGVYHYEFPNSLGIQVFNGPHRFYYKTNDIFTPSFLSQPFNIDQWLKKTEIFIEQIKNGNKKRQFLSETIPELSNDPEDDEHLLRKIVGKTYTDFVSDENHDVIMIYNTHNCSSCDQLLSLMLEIAKESRREGYYFLRFGYIVFEDNSAELIFPKIPSFPHIEIFPAAHKFLSEVSKSKTESLLSKINNSYSNSDLKELEKNIVSKTLFGPKSHDTIERFIMRYAKGGKCNFDIAPMQDVQKSMEVAQILVDHTEFFDEALEAKFKEFIADLAKENNFDLSSISNSKKKKKSKKDSRTKKDEL